MTRTQGARDYLRQAHEDEPGDRSRPVQPEAVRTFLLRTAILDRLCGPLCDAVCGSPGSTGVLQQIERSNLFLIPLDAKRHWYRYHQLFGELLRHELRQTDPDLVPALARAPDSEDRGMRVRMQVIVDPDGEDAEWPPNSTRSRSLEPDPDAVR